LVAIFKINETKNGLTFEVKVTPGVSRAQMVGFQDGALKLKVTAQPVEGAANNACIKLLSEALKLRKSQVEILAGAKSRRKIVLIKDVTRKDLEMRLNNVC
jgi:uncharacterized protein (TIGR00251 family)